MRHINAAPTGTRTYEPDWPFLIRSENVARYEDGEVLILDRRVYPFETTFVRCPTYEDVARAIEDMVTQSGGPGLCASYGMVQAARQAARLKAAAGTEVIAHAAKRLIHTRPTNNHIRIVVTKLLEQAREAFRAGLDAERVLLDAVSDDLVARHERGLLLGRAGADLLNDGDSILNHCWAETGIIYTLHAALAHGKKLQAFCTETRPYLQGARLTADAVAEMGVPTTVITDGMPAHLMSRGQLSVFFAGADRVTMDGHVINKIGTLQIALAARRFTVPFYAFCFGPDPQAPTPAEVPIEERDPAEVLTCRGVRTATWSAAGCYPAFDITPPDCVTGLVTDRGVFGPDKIRDYHAGTVQ